MKYRSGAPNPNPEKKWETGKIKDDNRRNYW